MLKKLILAISLGVIAASVYGQNIEIRGLIIDGKTEKPVAEAHVTVSTGEIAVTDASGRFILNIPGIPAVMRITHVSYGSQEYKVSTAPGGLLVIRINQEVTDLDEVQITGERLRILTRKDQFSIQEFAIDRQVIWFLGFINNQAGQQRLFAANLYGDTLASIPVRRAEKLFQDIFNTVHIVFNDSVYQLYHHDENQIEFLYPEEKNTFFNIMTGIEHAFNQKLVYSRESSWEQSLQIYYIQKDDPQRYQLVNIRDTLEANRQKTWNKIDRLMAIYNIPELSNMWTDVYRYTKRGTKFDRVIRQPIPYTLFKANDSLFIINYLKDSLLIYSADGKLAKSIFIDFHKVTSAGGPDYKDLTGLTDPITQKVFLLEHQMTRWILSPLNTATGKTGPVIRLPEFPGMAGICVYDNAVYFIYQEKTHPYYNRLYRYQI